MRDSDKFTLKAAIENNFTAQEIAAVISIIDGAVLASKREKKNETEFFDMFLSSAISAQNKFLSILTEEQRRSHREDVKAAAKNLGV